MAKVVHFEVVGKNGQKLRDFYSKTFNWQIIADNPMDYGMVSAEGEGSIGGGIGATPDGSSGHATFYIEVDDVKAVLKQVEKNGGAVVVPETVVPEMVTYAMFTDPEGHLVGLVKSEQ
jgi:predicted enzyme related to lactoylglutathione lyase